MASVGKDEKEQFFGWAFERRFLKKQAWFFFSNWGEGHGRSSPRKQVQRRSLYWKHKAPLDVAREAGWMPGDILGEGAARRRTRRELTALFLMLFAGSEF